MWSFAWQNLITRPSRTALAVVGLTIPILAFLGRTTDGGVRKATRRIPSFQGKNLPRPDSLIRSGSLPGWQAPASEPAGQGSVDFGGSSSERESVMRMRALNVLVSATLAGLVAIGAASESTGCTDFRVTAADGTGDHRPDDGLRGAGPLSVRVFRGERWSSDAPGAKKKKKGDRLDLEVRLHRHRHGRAPGRPPTVRRTSRDGRNEKGASPSGWLSMPDFTAYQDREAAAEPEKAIAHLDVCPWVLGNFCDGRRGEDGLAGVHVWASRSGRST
jgi:hypothetical protein